MTKKRRIAGYDKPRQPSCFLRGYLALSYAWLSEPLVMADIMKYVSLSILPFFIAYIHTHIPVAEVFFSFSWTFYMTRDFHI